MPRDNVRCTKLRCTRPSTRFRLGRGFRGGTLPLTKDRVRLLASQVARRVCHNPQSPYEHHARGEWRAIVSQLFGAPARRAVLRRYSSWHPRWLCGRERLSSDRHCSGVLTQRLLSFPVTAASLVVRVDALGLWVGVSTGGAELGPPPPVGDAPVAAHALDSQTLQGYQPDAFKAAGALAEHLAEPSPPHSSPLLDL